MIYKEEINTYKNKIKDFINDSEKSNRLNQALIQNNQITEQFNIYNEEKSASIQDYNSQLNMINQSISNNSILGENCDKRIKFIFKFNEYIEKR